MPSEVEKVMPETLPRTIPGAWSQTTSPFTVMVKNPLTESSVALRIPSVVMVTLSNCAENPARLLSLESRATAPPP